MNRFLTLSLLAFAAVAVFGPATAHAAADGAAEAAAAVMNLGPIGAGIGIGRIGGSAVESIARQPEMAGPIGTNMIIAAALVEGATLFAVVVGLLCLIL